MLVDHVRAFCVVATVGNVTHAARRLGLSQSATSRAIAGLEASLGATLLARGSRGVELTDAGAVVLERARAALASLDGLGTDLAPGDEREVVIACHEHIATHLLPRALERLASERPDVRPRVLAGPSRFVHDVVRDGDAELGLVIGGDRDARLERVEVGRVRCQLVIAIDAAPETETRFIGSREVDTPANKAYPTVAFLQQRAPSTTIVASSTSLESHKALVRRGFGVSILPLFMVEEELRQRTLRVLHPSYVYVAAVDLIAPPGRRLSRAARSMVRALQPALSCTLALGPHHRGKPLGEHPRRGSRRRAGRYGAAP